MDFLDKMIYGNTLKQWGMALGIAILTLAIFKIIKPIVVRRLRSLAQKTATEWDDLILNLLNQIKFFFLVSVAVYVGSAALSVSQEFNAILSRVVIIAFLFQAAVWASTIITLRLERFSRKPMESDPASVTTISAIAFVIKCTSWVIILILVH